MTQHDPRTQSKEVEESRQDRRTEINGGEEDLTIDIIKNLEEKTRSTPSSSALSPW